MFFSGISISAAASYDNVLIRLPTSMIYPWPGVHVLSVARGPRGRRQNSRQTQKGALGQGTRATRPGASLSLYYEADVGGRCSCYP